MTLPSGEAKKAAQTADTDAVELSRLRCLSDARSPSPPTPLPRGEGRNILLVKMAAILPLPFSHWGKAIFYCASRVECRFHICDGTPLQD